MRNEIKMLKEVFAQKRYIALALGISVLYSIIFLYIGFIDLGITTNDYLVNAAAVALNAIVIATTSIIFTLAIYYIIKTAKLRSAAGGATASVLSTAASTLVVCSCNISLLVPVLSFIGLGAANITALSAALLSYHLLIQGAILSANLILMYVYVNNFIRKGYCKTCT